MAIYPNIFFLFFAISIAIAQQNEELSTTSTPEAVTHEPGLEPDCLKDKLFKIKFDLRFMCGKYRGAEGRLFVRMRKALKGGLEDNYIELLDTVLREEHNGRFRQDVIVQMEWGQRHSFEMFFRTHCYVQNRYGECCAHDFKFIAENTWGNKGMYQPSWINTDYDEETQHRRCIKKDRITGIIPKDGKPFGRDCSFTFKTVDPHFGGDTIDVRKLLLEADNYYWKAQNATINKRWPKKKIGFTSDRVCSPRDDPKEPSIYERFENLFKEGYKFLLENWTICAHPNYGLHMDSFKKPEQEKYQKCKVPLYENVENKFCRCHTVHDQACPPNKECP